MASRKRHRWGGCYGRGANVIGVAQPCMDCPVERVEVVNENGYGQFFGTHIEYRVPGGAWARPPRVPPCEERDRG